MSPGVKVTSLNIYPIKACRGITVTSARVSPTGFAFDRAWMVVDDNYRFITQRNAPALATVVPSLPPEAVSQGGWESFPPDSAMTVRSPTVKNPLLVPLRADVHNNKAVIQVTVWDWSGDAIDEGDDASAWFTEHLGRPARLVRFSSKVALRATNPAVAEGFCTAFSDGYPYLLASQESLDDLNGRMEKSIPMNRFRPNIVVHGAGAFAEDGWTQFVIGAADPAKKQQVGFRNVKPCDRCKVPTTNQDTGVPEGPEPTKTMQTFRTGQALGFDKVDPQVSKAVFFGVNLVAEIATVSNVAKLNVVDYPIISVGDVVTLGPAGR